MIHITDAAYEGRLCRVEALEDFDRDESRSIGECSQNVPDPDGSGWKGEAPRTSALKSY